MRSVCRNFLRGAREICFWRSASNEHTAQNCFFFFFLKVNAGGGLICAKVYGSDLIFWRSTVYNTKFGQMYAAVTIMVVENYVLQFLEGAGRKNDFWQIIAEIHILVFPRRRASIEPPCVCHRGLFYDTVGCW